MLQIDAIPQGDFLSPCWRDACSFLRTTCVMPSKWSEFYERNDPGDEKGSPLGKYLSMSLP